MTTTVLDTNINEVDNKIPDTSGLVTTTVLSTKITEVTNEIPNHAKCITTSEFNKLTIENFTARLKQASLESQTEFDKNLTSFNRKITSNTTKYLEVQKKLNNLIIKDYIFFLGRISLQVMMDIKTLFFLLINT